MSASGTPAPYHKRLVLLDRSRHHGKCVLPVVEHAAARDMNAVFCAATEFGQACKVFPLLFIRSEGVGSNDAGSITPVCLLGLQNGENLFVDGQGRWTADYLPAFFRRYPFALVHTEQENAQAVAIDADYPGLVDRDGGGELLFTDDGQPTPHLQSVMQFLRDFDQAVQLTQPIGERLRALNLLKPMRAEGALPGGEKFVVDGFFVVDENRLTGLPDKALLALHREGLLALVHAHLISLGNLHRLVELRTRQTLTPALRTG